MKDLSLVTNIKKISDAEVKALKIEGRLKTSLWVKTITSIYRKALDSFDNTKVLENLREELKKYSAREKDLGHIKNHTNLIGKNEEKNGEITKNLRMNKIIK